MSGPLVAIAYYADPEFSPHVRRQARTLRDAGCQVWGIGITHPDQKRPPESALTRSDIATQPRFARRGPFSFLHFIMHVFFSLWKTRPDSIQAIDPPALLPCLAHAFMRRIPLHYLSLEDFPDCTPLVNRPVARAIWTAIEYLGVRGARSVAMVAQVDADSYVSRYGIPMPFIVRNIPELKDLVVPEELTLRKRFGWTSNQFVLMYHGTIEYGRGIEQVFEALQQFPDLRYAIAGFGEYRIELERQIQKRGITDQVGWVGPFAHTDLGPLLQDADLGIMLFHNVSKSFYQALPCKMFECVHAGVPVLASAFPAMQHYIESSHVGICVDPENTDDICTTIQELSYRSQRHRTLREHCLTERLRTNWEHESTVYLEFLGLPATTPVASSIMKVTS